MTFLGIEERTAYYGADISHLEDLGLADLPDGTLFEDLRRLATAIDNKTAGYLAYAPRPRPLEQEPTLLWSLRRCDGKPEKRT